VSATLLLKLTLLIPFCNLCCSNTAASDPFISSSSAAPMPRCACNCGSEFDAVKAQITVEAK
jgi:hypothetical protein